MSEVDILEAKFDLDQTSLWLTGVQAVARAVLEQAKFDQSNQIESAGYITGYRGSPLGGLDLVLGRMVKQLQDANIVFQPAVNEDLAATALWGSQQVGLFEQSKQDGVFGLWYGKSPGLDRSADAFRHANMAGTAPKGGVLAMVGDDPECKSSTLPSDSSGLLRDLQLPILDPADVREVIDFALYGWALSRFSGCWSSMLAQTSIMDSSATIELPKTRPAFAIPKLDFDPHIRLVDTPLDQEARLAQRIQAVQSFVSSNPINSVLSNPNQPKLTIVTTGKSYSNLRQAFQLLGLKTESDLTNADVRILKLGLIWPLDREWLIEQVRNSQVVLVIESKRAFIETSLRSLLYGKSSIPVVGKSNVDGQPLLTSFGELHIDSILRALEQLSQTFRFGFTVPPSVDSDVGLQTDTMAMNVQRKPIFCPGCPHAHSTKIPEGSRAHAGIGCHYMAQWMHRETYLFTHMGGEGANWIGQAPFTDTSHVFVNIGDGTYFHSGLLAIRAAVNAGVNVTYKVLFNDAVAMTGGQPVDGRLSVSDVVAQVAAEGVKDVRVVANEPHLHQGATYQAHSRTELQDVQRELRGIEGCTVLVVDHTCANEKRRKQKRGLLPQPDKFVVINEDVCEGCGDCVTQSGCSAVVPVQTRFGEKRQIDQTNCIQDEACLDGYCPALVQVSGTRKPPSKQIFKFNSSDLPEPDRLEKANILIAGVGGTGVLTISQLLAAAAHVEGKQVSTLDMTGLAQKGGAVISHVRIDASPLWNTRISSGQVDVLLGADTVTSKSLEVAELLAKDRTKAVVNSRLMPSYLSVIDRDQDYGSNETVRDVSGLVRDLTSVDAVGIAKEHTGGSTVANTVLLGYAYQLGLIPLAVSSIERAIELNQVAVEENLAGFNAGRFATLAVDVVVEDIARDESHSDSIEELIEHRFSALKEYQNEGYANQFKDLIKVAQQKDLEFDVGRDSLTRAVVQAGYKIFAYKDEYEVARLLTSRKFQSLIDQDYENAKMTFAFAPTWLRDASSGRKVHIGGWFRFGLRLLATLRGIREKWFDPFSYSKERKLDRLIRKSFIDDVNELIPATSAENYESTVQVFESYFRVAGYGRIRESNWRVEEATIKELKEHSLSEQVREVILQT